MASAFFVTWQGSCSTLTFIMNVQLGIQPQIKQETVYFGSIETAKQVGISLRQLYHWVDVLQVVSPIIQVHGKRSYRRFTAENLVVLRKMNHLVEQGYTPRAAVRRVISKDGIDLVRRS